MLADFQRFASMSRTSDIFVTRYNGSHTDFYLFRTLPLILLFVILTILYTDDEYRSWIFSRHPGNPKAFLWHEFGFLVATTIAGLVDHVLIKNRVHDGAVAFYLSYEGVTTHIKFKTGLVPWSYIDCIDWDGKYIVIKMKPRCWAEGFFTRKGTISINFPAYQLDKNIFEILAAAKRLSSQYLIV